MTVSEQVQVQVAVPPEPFSVEDGLATGVEQIAPAGVDVGVTVVTWADAPPLFRSVSVRVAFWLVFTVVALAPKAVAVTEAGVCTVIEAVNTVTGLSAVTAPERTRFALAPEAITPGVQVQVSGTELPAATVNGVVSAVPPRITAVQVAVTWLVGSTTGATALMVAVVPPPLMMLKLTPTVWPAAPPVTAESMVLGVPGGKLVAATSEAGVWTVTLMAGAETSPSASMVLASADDTVAPRKSVPAAVALQTQV